MLHVLTEVGFSQETALVYNGAVSFCFLIYLGWRAGTSPGVWRAWGIRLDNFWPALGAQLGFGLPAAAALVIFGAVTGAAVLPWTFWLTAGLYPVWGVAQQFALQNLLARNLAGLWSRPVAVAGTAALLFSAAHVPRLGLVLLTLVPGFFFTLIYRRHPNLWAVGTVHGFLGALAFYIVLQQDPGALIWELLTRR